MYGIIKQLEVSAAHNLSLPYESKCNGLHGHNWIIKVHCHRRKLNDQGMVIDFSEIKEKIHARLDHKYLNDVLEFQTTAENLAKWIYEQLQPTCYKVEIWESEGNCAVFEDTDHAINMTT